jgi:broad specificity phosphatase PhoE
MPSELTLLLVRHGETEWNAEGRFQGQCDVPLSDIGRTQAALLRDRLSIAWQDALPSLPGPPRAIFTSDLSRAYETAEVLAGAMDAPPPIRRTHLVRERSFGAWEGLNIAEIRERFGVDAQPEDSEPYAAVYARMVDALALIWEEALKDRDSAVVLLAGHGGSLRLLIAHALGAGPEAWQRIRLDNTGVSVVTYHGATAEDARGRVLLVNDTAHLTYRPSSVAAPLPK